MQMIHVSGESGEAQEGKKRQVRVKKEAGKFIM